MSDLESTDWSELAASNIQPAPAGWPSNSSPNIVYSTDREMMGAIKRDWNRRNPTVTSGGAANVQTLTYSSAPTAYIRGQCYCFIAGFSNSGAATLNVNGLGAKTVLLNNAALNGGELVAGLIVEVVYDGTNFQIIGGTGFLPLSGGTLTGALTVAQPAGIVGTTTNNAASAGSVGELISSNVTSPVTLTSGAGANVGSISLTAGDWDVTGEVWIAVGTGGATLAMGGINSATATIPGGSAPGLARMSIAAALTASNTISLPLRPARISLASTTTYFLVAQTTFPSGTTTATGNISARRAR